MKKIISFIIVAVFAVGSAFAANDLLDFEGVAGMNIANVDETECHSRIGFHVGVRGTYAFQSKDNGIYANAALQRCYRFWAQNMTVCLAREPIMHTAWYCLYT